MDKTKKEKLQALRFQMEEIDYLSWHGDGMIPEYARWYNVIGDEDANGNWLLPAEMLGDTPTEIQRIKDQRRILGQMRQLESAEENRQQTHRSKEEQERLLDNVAWVKSFGLSNSDCASILGEKLDYIHKMSSRLKHREPQSA